MSSDQLGTLRIIESARACVGARFRPQGRALEYGLDCIGVALHAYLPPEARATLRRGYRLRGERAEDLITEIESCPFTRIAGEAAAAGDLLVLESGPGQLHVAILTEAGFIHADARLRRVAEVPGPPPWPLIAAFRFCGRIAD